MQAEPVAQPRVNRVEFVSKRRLKKSSIKERPGSRATSKNNEDVSDDSRMTQINLLANVIVDGKSNYGSTFGVTGQKNHTSQPFHDQTVSGSPQDSSSDKSRSERRNSINGSNSNEMHLQRIEIKFSDATDPNNQTLNQETIKEAIQVSPHSANSQGLLVECQTPEAQKTGVNFVRDTSYLIQKQATTIGRDRLERPIATIGTQQEDSHPWETIQNASYTEVGSIATKHRASVTQISNDMQLWKVNNSIKGHKIETKKHEHQHGRKKQSGAHEGSVSFVEDSELNAASQHGVVTWLQANGKGALGQRQMKQSASFMLSAKQNQHAQISIFDRETEKSYLLERQMGYGQQMAGTGGDYSGGRGQLSSREHEEKPNEGLVHVWKANQGSSVFKVQEIGTAKFRCLPVTDFGKMMANRSRQHRKIQTASNRARSLKPATSSVGKKIFNQRTMVPRQGVTSYETFHIEGPYKQKFTADSAQKIAKSQAVSKRKIFSNIAEKNPHLEEDEGADGKKRHSDANFNSARGKNAEDSKQRLASDDNGSNSTKRDESSPQAATQPLRSSKSTAAGKRNQIFSKTKLNALSQEGNTATESAVPIIERQVYRMQQPLTAKSSNNLAKTADSDVPMSQATLSSTYMMKQPGQQSQAPGPTAKQTLTANQFPGGQHEHAHSLQKRHLRQQESFSRMCGCSPRVSHGVYRGTNGIAVCQKCGEQIQGQQLTQSKEKMVYLEPQEKKYMRKRAQSQENPGFRRKPSNNQGGHLINPASPIYKAQVSSTLLAGQPFQTPSFTPRALTSEQALNVCTRLMAIAADLRRNILANEASEQVVNIYRTKIGDFLGMLGMHGPANSRIVDIIFNMQEELEEGSIFDLLMSAYHASRPQIAIPVQRPIYDQNQQTLSSQLMSPTSFSNEYVLLSPSTAGTAFLSQQNLAQGMSPQGNFHSVNDMNLSGHQLHLNMANSFATINGPRIALQQRQASPFLIDTMRQMPGHAKLDHGIGYFNRSRKDPVKVTQFQMGEPEGSLRSPGTLSQDGATMRHGKAAAQPGLQERMAHAMSQPKVQRPAPRNKLQAAIQQTKDYIINSQIMAAQNTSQPIMAAGKIRNYQTAPAKDIMALAEKTDQETAKMITQRNKQQMMAISADEVDRMLYKVGLASNSMVKRVQNEKIRRNFNQRRVSAKVSQLSNLQSLQKDTPPNSTLASARVAPTSSRQMAQAGLTPRKPNSIGSHKSSIVVSSCCMRDGFSRSPRSTNVRKSLELKRLRNRNSVMSSEHKDVNASPLEEEASFIQLAPKQLNQNLNGGGVTKNRPHQLGDLSHREDNMLNSLDLKHIIGDVTNMVLMNGASNYTDLNPQANGSLENGQPAEAMATKVMKLNAMAQDCQNQDGMRPGHVIGLESQKMVKTYEFHLPMHHIREEEHKSLNELKKQGSGPSVGSRYNLSKQSTVYRLAKKKTGNIDPSSNQQLNSKQVGQQKRDDISSQMLEDGLTMADQQNSLRNLNLHIGSSFFGEQREIGSQASITKQLDDKKVRRSQQLIASFTGINHTKSQVENEPQRASSKNNKTTKRTGAANTSQSIDLSSSSRINKMQAGIIAINCSGEHEKGKTISEWLGSHGLLHRNKKHMSNLTTKAMIANSTETSGKMLRRMRNNNRQYLSPERTSPLICLSSKDLNAEKKNNGTEGTSSQSPSNTLLSRPRTNDSKRSANKSPSNKERASLLATRQTSLMHGSALSKMQLQPQSYQHVHTLQIAGPKPNVRVHVNRNLSIGSRARANFQTRRNSNQSKQQQLKNGIRTQRCSTKPRHTGATPIDTASNKYVKRVGTHEPRAHSRIIKESDGGAVKSSNTPGTPQSRTMVSQTSRENKNATQGEQTNPSVHVPVGSLSSPHPPVADVFLMLSSPGSSQQPEFLEIAQKNFELFGQHLETSANNMTASSHSLIQPASSNPNNSRERQALGALAANLDSSQHLKAAAVLTTSGQSIKDFVGQEQIEVFNISQGVQTSTMNQQAVSQNDISTNQSPRDLENQIRKTLNQNAKRHEEEIRMKRLKDLLENVPYEQTKTQVKISNFNSNVIKSKGGRQSRQGRTVPNSLSQVTSRHTKSLAEGSRWRNTSMVKNQFRQPGFKQSQQFFIKKIGNQKVSILKQQVIEDAKSQIAAMKTRFTTFRANNELIMRIEAPNEDLEGPAQTSQGQQQSLQEQRQITILSKDLENVNSCQMYTFTTKLKPNQLQIPIETTRTTNLNLTQDFSNISQSNTHRNINLCDLQFNDVDPAGTMTIEQGAKLLHN